MSSAARASSAVMRAIRVSQFGGPEVLKLHNDVPIPKPTGTQVLLKIHASGVNPVDTYIRTGTHAVKPKLPYSPHMDGAGVVEGIGEGVTNYKPGDRVFCARAITGTLAEYCLAEENVTFPLHENLSFAQGASMGVPYFTAYRAISKKCQARPGQSLLVHGASGAVGIACCQIGRAMGLRVYGTAGTEEGMKLAQENGAHKVYNHRKEDYLQEIWKETGEKGVDIVAEMLANVNLESVCKIVALNGHVAIIGSRGSIEFTPRLTMAKELCIHGVLLLLSTADEWKEASEYLYTGQEGGWIKPVVGEVYPLAESSKAHEEVIAHTSGSKGKIVVDVTK